MHYLPLAMVVIFSLNLVRSKEGQQAIDEYFRLITHPVMNNAGYGNLM
jgi:hypothetical protein